MSTERIRAIEVSSHDFPTPSPEADGTIEWSRTTVVLVQVHAAGHTGIGYSYASRASAVVAEEVLKALLQGQDPMATERLWSEMIRRVRNLGRPGVASHAISAVDTALWDLKARILGMPLFRLLGAARSEIAAYGSGGFTSFSDGELREQLAGWAESGMKAVKMKVGTHPDRDAARVRSAREAIGPGVELFVDANGAYDCQTALRLALGFADEGVTWFEEPVSSDDLDGLRFVRGRAPAGMRIAAGEYGYDSPYFRKMLAAGAVDVLQADATRCLGVTGFMRAAAIAESFMVPFSAHTSPTLHAHLACAVPHAINVEYFADHARIEPELFEGAILAERGLLRPDRSRSGLGIELRLPVARRTAA